MKRSDIDEFLDTYGNCSVADFENNLGASVFMQMGGICERRSWQEDGFYVAYGHTEATGSGLYEALHRWIQKQKESDNE